MAIKVSNITKKYGSQTAVDRVSFELNKGEIVGFLGPNGAGKSTIMKMVVGYLEADEGQILLDGSDISMHSIAAKKQIGYLPENNPLYGEMYIREYLNFLAAVRKVPVTEVDRIIEKTGLSPELGKQINALSKGYKQRVGLAAALLHDPEVLILDEPTTGLDPNQLVEIRALIKTVGADKTVLFSSHIMQEVEAICDRVILINKGNILADKQLKDLKLDNKQIIEVTFQDPCSKDLLEQLSGIKSIKSKDQLTFELLFETNEDRRSTVFDFAASNALTILQLTSKNKNLEELFREMTSNSV